ncbi:MAG: APC family permease [Acidobacteria bacterium]|nr:MAG: APC family permease [Acidobacteriota bacterium]
MASTAAPSLARSLRRWDLVGVVLNGVIGAGIFGLPSKIFSLTGADSIFAFGACAVCVSTFVLCFAEVASRYSGTGGPYLYARETYGPTVGFTVGWLVWIARLTSFAANSNLLPAYLDLLFPGAGSGVPRVLILTGIVALLALVNIRGVRLAADASNTLAIGKLLPLAVFIIAGLLFLDPARFSFTMSPGYRPLTQSLLLLVYAFTGFEMAVIPAGEARKPERDLPRALLMGMATVVAFYVLIQVVCIGTLPGLAASQRPLADAANHFLGTWGAVMITVGIVISLAGNLNVLVLAASRVLFAMAENGELPRRLQQVHPRFRIPVSGVLWTSAAMLALTLSGTFIYLVTISAISRLVTYIVTCSALPVLRRRTTAPKAAFRMPAGVAVSLIGIVLALWLLSNITLREARDTALATAAGLCIYVFTRIFRSQRS